MAAIDDDVGLAVEAVHLDQDLVQGLLALVVRAAEAGAALAANGVDFVHEDDAGRVALGLVEQVAHAAGADADEHLDELGAGDGEERHARLAGHGARQQRLAGARRADQQHAARDTRAERGELLRVLQELHHFGKLLLSLLHPGDVGEGDGRLVAGEEARPALAERQGLVVGALRLAHHKDKHANQEQGRQQEAENTQVVAPGRSLVDFDREGIQRILGYVVIFEYVVNAGSGFFCRGGRGARTIGVVADCDFVAIFLSNDFLYFPGLYLRHYLRDRNFLWRRGALHKDEKEQQHGGHDNDPYEAVAQPSIF